MQSAGLADTHRDSLNGITVLEERRSAGTREEAPHPGIEHFWNVGECGETGSRTPPHSHPAGRRWASRDDPVDLSCFLTVSLKAQE